MGGFDSLSSGTGGGGSTGAASSASSGQDFGNDVYNIGATAPPGHYVGGYPWWINYAAAGGLALIVAVVAFVFLRKK